MFVSAVFNRVRDATTVVIYRCRLVVYAGFLFASDTSADDRSAMGHQGYHVTAQCIR